MKKRILYGLWAFLYVLCAGLSFIPQPTEILQVAMTLLSLVFFAPGIVLLVDAIRSKNKKSLFTLRLISLCSLGLTTIAYICNLLSATASDAAGTVLYYVLLVVSAPMVSMGYELVSLFLWACLLFATFVSKD